MEHVNSLRQFWLVLQRIHSYHHRCVMYDVGNEYYVVTLSLLPRSLFRMCCAQGIRT
jgi:hypothetical protein